MSSPAHQIIEQQRRRVVELHDKVDQRADGHSAAELRAKRVEAETELRGMERIFAAVFGSASKAG